MLRWSDSWTCWLLTAVEIFETLRFRFSEIAPNSSFELISILARLSPDANRSENSASFSTGVSTLFDSTTISESAAVTASPAAAISAELADAGMPAASPIPAPLECEPA